MIEGVCIMIKVIKPAKAEYRCTCPSCEAILEFRNDDIEWEFGNYNQSYEIIMCPECQSPIYRLDNWGADRYEKINYD